MAELHSAQNPNLLKSGKAMLEFLAHMVIFVAVEYENINPKTGILPIPFFELGDASCPSEFGKFRENHRKAMEKHENDVENSSRSLLSRQNSDTARAVTMFLDAPGRVSVKLAQRVEACPTCVSSSCSATAGAARASAVFSFSTSALASQASPCTRRTVQACPDSLLGKSICALYIIVPKRGD